MRLQALIVATAVLAGCAADPPPAVILHILDFDYNVQPHQSGGQIWYNMTISNTGVQNVSDIRIDVEAIREPGKVIVKPIYIPNVELTAGGTERQFGMNSYTDECWTHRNGEPAECTGFPRLKIRVDSLWGPGYANATYAIEGPLPSANATNATLFP